MDPEEIRPNWPWMDLIVFENSLRPNPPSLYYKIQGKWPFEKNCSNNYENAIPKYIGQIRCLIDLIMSAE
ncbi:unnamed protein product [Linum trigynum]|uniref:Uncharacterized protein n=1 Tax=Linum trigynum TaxID=586398 RepID=A0AAV2C8S2_9ROSI